MDVVVKITWWLSRVCLQQICVILQIHPANHPILFFLHVLRSALFRRRIASRNSPSQSLSLICETIAMLYLIGLGLADETDITVKGLEVVKRAERVYLEAYTSILHVGKDKLVG